MSKTMADVGREGLNRSSLNRSKSAILFGRDMDKILCICGESFEDYPSKKRKFCSLKCYWNSLRERTGERCSSWRGGRRKHSAGYIRILVPDHPYSREDYVFEHRLVMEKHIGRYLRPEEVVHHINGIKNDNRIENLELFNNESLHQKSRYKNKQGIENV